MKTWRKRRSQTAVAGQYMVGRKIILDVY